MKKIKASIKVITVIIIILIIYFGCSMIIKSSKKASEAKNINIMANLNDIELSELKKICKSWSNKNGVKVNIDKVNDINNDLNTLKNNKKVDIILGISNEYTGTLAKNKIVGEIPKGIVKNNEYLNKGIIDAGKYKGKEYGVPLFADTYALFYNKSLIPKVSDTSEKLLEQAKAKGFEYDAKNLYYSYALIASNGGYIFKNNDGDFDTKKTGLGDEAIPGLKVIESLVKNNIITAKINKSTALQDFKNGKIAFYVGDTKDLDEVSKSGINFGVSELPAINGKNAKSLMKVQESYVLKSSKNEKKSWNLIKYIQNDKNLSSLVKVDSRLPVKKSIKYSDEKMNEFVKQLKNSDPIPGIPEMAAVWKVSYNALDRMINGKITAEEAAQIMKNDLEKEINTMS